MHGKFHGKFHQDGGEILIRSHCHLCPSILDLLGTQKYRLPRAFLMGSLVISIVPWSDTTETSGSVNYIRIFGTKVILILRSVNIGGQRWCFFMFFANVSPFNKGL